MVIELLLLILGISALVIGTVTDIRIREVPDWLNFSLIPAGIALRLLHALIFNDWLFLAYGLLGLAVFVALGFFLYYTRQWGGGDSKLLMGVGVVFATYPEFLLNYFQPIVNWPFLLIFLFNLLFIGAFYSLFWSVILAFSHWKEFSKAYKNYLNSFKLLRMLFLGIVLAVVVFSIFAGDMQMRVVLIGLSLLSLLTIHFMLFAKAVESCCMVRTIPAGKLTEGDWVVKEVRVKGRYICGPKDYGATKEQIALLKKNKVKTIVIKEGIPFVPSFLAAMIVSLVWGNIIYFFI
jgi:Flp pilus assembly protein protease CpaA